MTKQFLVTRPNHDKQTSYLHSFSKAAVVIIKENTKIRLTDLEGADAVRYKFEEALNTAEPTLVFLNGHGDDESVCGHKDEIILDKNNIELSKNKIVYALACDSLVGLGELAVSKGAQAYIGYRDKFMWVGDPAKSAAPDKDKNAAPFRKVCHTLISSLIKGMTVNETIKKTRFEYKRLIRNYGTSEDNFGDAPAIGFALAWNLTALDFEGKPSASF